LRLKEGGLWKSLAWGVRKVEGAVAAEEEEEAEEGWKEEEPRGPAELKPATYEVVPFVERGVVGCGVEVGVPFFLFSNISRPTLSRASLSMCEVIAAGKERKKEKKKERKKVEGLDVFCLVVGLLLISLALGELAFYGGSSRVLDPLRKKNVPLLDGVWRRSSSPASSSAKDRQTKSTDDVRKEWRMKGKEKNLQGGCFLTRECDGMCVDGVHAVCVSKEDVGHVTVAYASEIRRLDIGDRRVLGKVVHDIVEASWFLSLWRVKTMRCMLWVIKDQSREEGEGPFQSGR
jgi:hypothetical protein